MARPGHSSFVQANDVSALFFAAAINSWNSRDRCFRPLVDEPSKVISPQNGSQAVSQMRSMKRLEQRMRAKP